MIFSFSVPENEKNRMLLHWYRNEDPQERSRKFREIFMEYLKRPTHTMEKRQEDHVSLSIKQVEMDIINSIGVNSNAYDDLDGRLDLMGIGGEVGE